MKGSDFRWAAGALLLAAAASITGCATASGGAEQARAQAAVKTASIEDVENLYAKGENEAAVKLLAEVVPAGATSAEVIKLAKSFEQKGLYRGALGSYGIALGRASDKRDAYLGLAENARRLGLHSEALKYYRTLLEAGKKPGGRTLLFAALEAAKAGDRAAQEQLIEELRRQGRSAEIFELWAAVALDKGQYEKALTLASIALEAGEGDPSPHLFSILWSASLALGDLAAASQYADKALSLWQDFAEANLASGIVAVYTKDFGKAEEYFRKSLASSPRLASARTGLGVSLVGQKRFKEAQEVLEEGVRLHPGEGDFYCLLGMLAEKADNDRQKAGKMFSKFVEIAKTQAVPPPPGLLEEAKSFLGGKSR